LNLTHKLLIALVNNPVTKFKYLELKARKVGIMSALKSCNFVLMPVDLVYYPYNCLLKVR